jgi:predicted phosphodiesterase
VSKRTSRRRKRSTSQTLFWILSGLLAGMMVISLIIVAFPGAPNPTPTPLSTWTPQPPPSATPSPVPRTSSPTSLPSASPTVRATAPVIGPLPATATPTVAPSFTPTFTATPTATLTATPAAVKAPPGTGPDFTFAVCGDSRDGPEVYRQVLASVMAGGSEFLIHTGDLVDGSTEDEWLAFRQAMVGFTLPFYPVPGNHDGIGDQNLEGYLRYSGAAAAHYSVDRGLVHLTMADSHNGGISASELAWLRDDLSATRQPVKIVVLHHPPFDPDGTSHIMAYGNEQFMALMVQQNVDYVLAGHIHASVQGERDGVVYTITGGAGAPLYTADHPQAFYHYLRVSVQGEKVTIEPIRI